MASMCNQGKHGRFDSIWLWEPSNSKQNSHGAYPTGNEAQGKDCKRLPSHTALEEREDYIAVRVRVCSVETPLPDFILLYPLPVSLSEQAGFASKRDSSSHQALMVLSSNAHAASHSITCSARTMGTSGL